MVQRLRNDYGLVVDKETVRLILKTLDPEGVERRSRRRLKRRKYYAKGPNYIWHIDGYDKLKPFGFCIHGAIDGYSRRVYVEHLVFIKSVTMAPRDPLVQLRCTKEQQYARSN